MYIGTLTASPQYEPTENPQKQAEENRRLYGEILPNKDTVTISNQAKITAEVDRIRYHQESSGSRALAYGDVIYIGPPTLSHEEISARLDLWQKYENTSTMESFRRSTIKLYETETRIDTSDDKIGEKLKNLYENFHTQLLKLETNQKVA